ncbi:MAG: DNA polymerase III subunit gamma/tau [Candidatus Dadabacteria bacterium]|nr:DNA polymerase III subunit gamma/tau [Candidatus Dadabacteria bacterium]
MSSYVVLARKLRPRTFDEVIGQGYIVKALCNAARSEKLAHALLFTGPRGVGKTSTARIVAKTVNCENPSPEKRPCGADNPCESCSLISEGRAVEVQEMDAASHTSVNDVRDIIEKARYTTASGKTKIYIIDEAHMLSQAAFNALLKTLEEPPAHVLFILATTEPHKIPATILSRCQRYDFRKVSTPDISAALEAAAKGQNIKVEPETVSTIALEADGSVRDALSLLDQLAATFGAEIDHGEAMALLGFVDANLMDEMFEAVMKRDPAKGFETLGKALDKGTSPAKFAEGITSLLRTATVLKIGGAGAVPDIAPERAEFLLSAAADSSAESLEMLFDIAIDACERVGRSFYPEMAAEAMALKLCAVEKAVPLDDIMRRLEKLAGGGTAEYSSAPAPKKRATTLRETPESNGSAAPAETRAGKGGKTAEEFSNFLKSGEKDFGYMASMVSKCEITLENSVAAIGIPKKSVMDQMLSDGGKKKDFLAAAEQFFGCKAKIAHTDAQANGAAAPKDISEEPIVRRALEMFDGRIKTLETRRAK